MSPVMIHGNEYVTVAERLAMMHEAHERVSIATSIIQGIEGHVTVKAFVDLDGRTYEGHASSDLSASGIEGQSPLEVAETSAIGRALGFAGFGAVESVASADEVVAANGRKPADPDAPECRSCHAAMERREGEKKGRKWAGWFCPDDRDHEPQWIDLDAVVLPDDTGDVSFEAGEPDGKAEALAAFWQEAKENGLATQKAAHEVFDVGPEKGALKAEMERRAQSMKMPVADVWRLATKEIKRRIELKAEKEEIGIDG